jgi:hypothetical protein
MIDLVAARFEMVREVLEFTQRPSFIQRGDACGMPG